LTTAEAYLGRRSNPNVHIALDSQVNNLHQGTNTLSIKGFFVIVSIATLGHFSECRILFIVKLNVIMPNVVIPSELE
jgi:hypothetical protein